MSNPVMSRNPYFQQAQTRPREYGMGTAPNQFQQQGQPYADPYQYGQYPGQAQQQYAQAGYGEQFGGYPGAFEAPAAPGLLTYREAMNKTGLLLGLAILAGTLTAVLLPPAAAYAVTLPAVLIAFGIGMAIAFQRMVKPGFAIAYSVIEGVALGGITLSVNSYVPGAAFQAILATIVIVAVTLFLHYSGRVRTTPKGRKFVMIIAIGGIIFSLINLVLMLTGVSDKMWGLRSETVGGIPLGIILGVVMIFVAAYFLIGDFEDVQTAVDNGAPREFAWTVGIAIVMTVLWIYLEVLRLIAIIASDR